MTYLDWAIIVLYFVAMVVVGLAVTKRAGGSLAEYFVSGRRLNWFLAGASLVATSFASDTPLWVSGLVRRFGVHTVWQYWATALGAGVAVFVFARLWRRLAVLTDLEFIEVRYDGRGAAFLRGLYAFYGSLIFNALVIGWVTKAMQLILMETLQLSEAGSGWAVAIAVVIALIYCAFAGLWGVVLTDLIQIILATIGTIALAFFAVRAVGGLDALVQQLHALPAWPGNELTIGPKLGSGPGYLSVWNALAFACLLWWPLAVSNGYAAQRVLATTDERQSAFTMLMYTIVYWGINAWPWIITALCSLVLLKGFDGGPAEERAYPYMIMHYLPSGWRGLLLVAMAAAFMSTISTLINWGSSYFINDFYKRFLTRHRSERHYVFAARWASVLMTVMGGIVAYHADSIQVLIQIGGMLTTAMCFLLVLRWFWWRMNAWSEIAGVLACLVMTVLILVVQLFNAPARSLFGEVVQFHSDYDYFGLRIMLVFFATVLTAAVVAWLTKPTSDDVLATFLRRTRPFKAFWRPVLRRTGVVYDDVQGVPAMLMGWLSVTVCIIALIYGLGELLLGSTGLGLLFLAASVIGLFFSVRAVNLSSGTAADAARPAPAVLASVE